MSNRLMNLVRRQRRRFNSGTKVRYLLSCAVGSLLGGLAFTWMLTAGNWHIFQWQKLGSFYDAQAHSLLNGHWDVPQKILGIESFTVEGKSYLYQGPVPALLRLPIVAFGDRLDGRLTQLSMLVAYVVIMCVITQLSWRLREIFRPRAPMTLGECLGMGAFLFLLGGGSSLLYIASRAWVYHEALIWGVAFSLAATNSMLGHLTKPSWRSRLTLCLLTTAALMTRASIGIGPLIGLGLIGLRELSQAVPWRSQSLALATSLKRTFVLATLPAIPLVCYATVNYIKFRTLFSVPFAAQGFTLVDPARQRMLAENNGTLFGIQFIPTTLWHYLDPTSLAISRRFPFIDFPPIPGRVIGDVQFDLIDRNAGVPVSFPILCALAVVGIWAVVRPRKTPEERPSARILSLPLFATATCAATLLPFGYIAQRYLSDFFPFLVLASLAGFHHLGCSRSTKRARTVHPLGAFARRVRLSTVLLVALGIFTFAVNASLALTFQREYSSDVPPGRVAGFIGFQNDVDSWLGRRLRGFRPPSVQVHDELPDEGAPGTLVIVGKCTGMYLNDGMLVNAVKRSPWVPVERTRQTGLHRASARFSGAPKGTSESVVLFKDAAFEAEVRAVHLDGGHMRFSLVDGAHFGFDVRGLPVPVVKDRDYVVEVVADARVHSLIVRLDDRIVLETFYWFQGDAVSFPKRFRELPVQATLCPKVLASAGLKGGSESNSSSYKN